MSYIPPVVTDIRDQLPHTARVVGTRQLAEIVRIVVHCDGAIRKPGASMMPAVRADAQYHIDKDWRSAADKAAGSPVEHGDGLMYHYVVTDDTIYRTRAETEVTWHANAANRGGLAIMLPGGFNQEPTPGQLSNLAALLEWLCYHRPDIIAGRKDVYGHGELTQYGNNTPCPGVQLLAWVRAYRAGSKATPMSAPAPTPAPTPATPAAPAPTPADEPPDNPVVGPATIRLVVFEAQLKRRNSPALADGHQASEYYEAIKSYNIDPAVALGFFGKESEFGTYEHSPVNLSAACNWGNMRPAAALVGQEGSRANKEPMDSGKFGLFATFPNWMESCRGWCEYMLRRYPGQSVKQLLPEYAPEEDGNDPVGYARTVNGWIRDWQKL